MDLCHKFDHQTSWNKLKRDQSNELQRDACWNKLKWAYGSCKLSFISSIKLLQSLSEKSFKRKSQDTTQMRHEHNSHTTFNPKT